MSSLGELVAKRSCFCNDYIKFSLDGCLFFGVLIGGVVFLLERAQGSIAKFLACKS